MAGAAQRAAAGKRAVREGARRGASPLVRHRKGRAMPGQRLSRRPPGPLREFQGRAAGFVIPGIRGLPVREVSPASRRSWGCRRANQAACSAQQTRGKRPRPTSPRPPPGPKAAGGHRACLPPVLPRRPGPPRAGVAGPVGGGTGTRYTKTGSRVKTRGPLGHGPDPGRLGRRRARCAALRLTGVCRGCLSALRGPQGRAGLRH